MPQTVNVDGEVHLFPDEAEPEQIQEALKQYTKPKPAPFKGAARDLLATTGEGLKGHALAREAVSSYGVRQMMRQAAMSEAAPTIEQPEAQAALKQVESPGEMLRRTMGSEQFQTGAELGKIAQEEHPLTPQEERSKITSAGRMVGQMLPILMTGPAAPLAIGLESAGGHITGDYENAKREGKTDDQAAEIAVNRAAKSGALQAGVFAVLPTPLRMAASKYLINRLGQSGFRRWLSGQTARFGEGAALGTASAGTENVVSGRPVTEGMLPAAVGMGVANVLPGILKTPPRTPARSVPPETAPTEKPVAKPSDRKWQVVVQSPQTYGDKTISGYVQIDDVTGSKNHWSLGPDGLREQGVEVPDFSKLPQGKYDWEEAVKMLRETAEQRGGKVDAPKPTEDDYLAAERQAMQEAEKQGSPAKVVDIFTGEQPNLPFAGQFMRPTADGIEIKKDEFRDWLQGRPPEKRAEAIKQRVAEEHIHRHVTNDDALTYLNSLSALEKAAEHRQYTGYWSRGKLKAEKGAEFSDTQLGHEAIRRRIQRLSSGTSSEIAEAAFKEKWTLKSLDALVDIIRGIRENLGTKASQEGIAVLERAQANLSVARAALGDTPAAYDKRRKKEPPQPGLDLPEGKAGEARPGATDLGARPFTSVDLDKAGYAHIQNETERIRTDLEKNPGRVPKALSFDDYKAELQSKFGDLKPGQLYESFSKNLYNRLFNASGATLEALQRSLGIKGAGRVPDPPQRRSLLETEPGSPAARAQLKAEQTGAASRQRYRIGAIAKIADNLLSEAQSQSDAKPTRTSVSPEDLRYSGQSKEPAFWDVSRSDLDQPEILGKRLSQDSRRSNRDPVSLTKRVTALLDRQTGKVHLVSTYPHGRSGAMLLDPSVTGLKSHRPLSQLLTRYRPVASMLLDEPVRNFRQSFESLGDFENRIGTDARRSTQRTFEPPLGEGEQEKPGALESGGPITDAEAASILDHVYEESGTFDSPDDVKASLAALKEDTNFQVLSGYRKLAAELLKKNPDLSDVGIVNQLAQNIYENHTASTGEDAFKTFVARTMEQGGATDRPGTEVAPTPPAGERGKELTMPLERVPPTTVRPEMVPPGSIPEKRASPPVPEGTPVPATNVPRGNEPAAFNKQAKAAWDEVWDRLSSEFESLGAAVKGVPAGDLIARSVDDARTYSNNFSREREVEIRLPSQKPASSRIGKLAEKAFGGDIRGKPEVLSGANALVQAQAFDQNGNIINTRKGQLTIFKRMVRTGLQTALDMVRTGQAPPNIGGLQGMTAQRVRRIGRAWERSNRELLKELNYAYDHWDDPELQETARRMKTELDAQYQREVEAGKDVSHDPNYLPGRYDAELWSNDSVLFGPRSTVWGKQWRQPKKFQTYYHAAENGSYIPVTRDGASLVGHRVRQGTSQINRAMTEEGWQNMKAPDGRPVAVPPSWTATGWTAPDKTYVHVARGLAKPLLIHPDYANLVKQLVGESPLETFAPTRAALHAAQALKHTLLLGDFFHLGRVVYYGASILGKDTGFKGGWSVLDIPENRLGEAVQKGVISQADADWGRQTLRYGTETITRRELARRFMGRGAGQPGGLNVGKIQDALYKDLLTQMTPSAGPMRRAIQRPIALTVGKYNRFLFDKLTRGLMMETAVKEFERQSGKLPNADPNALMRDIARDTNNYYGNIGKQGWLKAQWAQDAARMLFLAPQWLEGLIKKEAIGASRLTGLSKVTGQRQGLSALGTTGRGIGRGLLAMFVLTQALNLFSRGKTTMQNEEKGHKMDAFIPLGKDGFWFSPFAVFNELTHDLWRFMNTKKTFADAVEQIAGNKLSPLTRAVLVGATGVSPTGQHYTTTLGRVKGVGKALVPVPITFGKLLRTAGHAIAPGTVAANQPGALTRQAFATAGIKIEPKESARAETYDLAKDWAKKTGHHKETGWLEVQTDEASYSKLRSAVSRNDPSEAKKIYDDLKKSHKSQEIRKAMMPFTVSKIPGTDVYQRRYKPFSGAKKTEGAFLQSLTPHQRDVYKKARQEQDALWQQFKVMQQKWG